MSSYSLPRLIANNEKIIGSNKWLLDSPRARQSGMQSQVGLRKHHTNKANGGDGIPVELFQILTDDAVKVLHSNAS